MGVPACRQVIQKRIKVGPRLFTAGTLHGGSCVLNAAGSTSSLFHHIHQHLIKADAYTNLHELLVNLHVYWVLASLHPTYIQLTCCSEYRMITYCIMIIYKIETDHIFMNTRTPTPVPVTSSRPTLRLHPSLPRAYVRRTIPGLMQHICKEPP